MNITTDELLIALKAIVEQAEKRKPYTQEDIRKWLDEPLHPYIASERNL